MYYIYRKINFKLKKNKKMGTENLSEITKEFVGSLNSILTDEEESADESKLNQLSYILDLAGPADFKALINFVNRDIKPANFKNGSITEIEFLAFRESCSVITEILERLYLMNE